MIKIPSTTLWTVVTIIASLAFIGVGALLYTLYGDLLTERDKVTQILTPENFVGGLTSVHEGVGTVKPTEVVELKDGDVFNLEASIVTQEVGNRLVKRLAYNGQIPGPVLKVEKGAKITVNLTNNIDMETALHSHGLRGNWKMDGAVPVSQDPIPIGGTFTYELEFPDTGVFWYHPHVREDYQQELGLYGNMIVSEQNYWNEVDQEEYLIFDDILENGDFDATVVTHTLMGRYGDTILINDSEDFSVTVKQGEISRFFLTNVANVRTFDLGFSGAFVKQVGGDNGRSEKEVAIEKTVIAPSERYVLELLYQDPGTYPILNRGQKIGEVVVEPSDAFKLTEFKELRSNASDYGNIRENMSELLKHKPDKRLRLDISLKNMSSNGSSTLGQVDSEGNVVVMGVKMTKEKGIEHCRVMSQMPECGPLLGSSDAKIVTLAGKEMTEAQARQHCLLVPNTEGCDKYKVEGIPVVAPHMHEGGIEWEDGMIEVNQMSSNETIEWLIEDQDTSNTNSAINWSFSQGDMVKIRVFNDGKGLHPMQHPLHFHGQRFVVLGRDGVANDNLQWKDTVLIPMGQTVDLLVDMSNPGTWMAHCHIAEHLSSGMMFNFSVN
jgi:FtsP/CotA-like multicopper oxidase with cupredoxin domain